MGGINGNVSVEGDTVYYRQANGTLIVLEPSINATVKVDRGGYIALEQGNCLIRIWLEGTTTGSPPTAPAHWEHGSWMLGKCIKAVRIE